MRLRPAERGRGLARSRSRVRDVVMMGRYGHLGFTRRPRRGRPRRRRPRPGPGGADRLADRQIGQLSGGQKKRAFVARGIAQGATMLLLDEPFAGVDKRSEATITACCGSSPPTGAPSWSPPMTCMPCPQLCDEAVLLMRNGPDARPARGGAAARATWPWPSAWTSSRDLPGEGSDRDALEPAGQELSRGPLRLPAGPAEL